MIKRRSSYSITNAIRFKSYFDIAIETKENFFISASRVSLSPTTMQQQASDALLFICNEYNNIVAEELMPRHEIQKHSQMEYMALKGMICIKIIWEPEVGIALQFKNTDKDLKIVPVKKDADLATTHWKDKLIDFIEKGNVRIFSEENLYLTADDMTWLHNTLGSVDCEYTVTPTKIVAVKRTE